ncbi:hypothetical protein LINGRAHAP2_LOCUS29985 [Linum grandiflorum]
MKTDNTRRSSSPTRWGDDELRIAPPLMVE